MLDAVLSLTASEAGVEEVTEDAVATVSYFHLFLNCKWGLTSSIFTEKPKMTCYMLCDSFSRLAIYATQGKGHSGQLLC